MNLFVYGTLRITAIWEAVSGNQHARSLPATLAGYRMQRVKGGDFPVITADHLAVDPIPGTLMLDVSQEALCLLDAYEDSFYIRKKVTVATALGPREAEAYTLPRDRADLLSDEPWSLAWFEETALARFWEQHFSIPRDEPTINR